MSVDPGNGYRLLSAGEQIEIGDSYRPIGRDTWLLVHERRQCDLISEYHVPHRRKVEGPTGTEAAVCHDIAARQRAGVAKYGTTVADNPLSVKQWLQHAYEECLDQAVYLRRAIDEIGI